MYIKIEIKNRRLEWNKNRLISDKWAIQNNSDAFAATHINVKKLQ